MKKGFSPGHFQSEPGRFGRSPRIHAGEERFSAPANASFDVAHFSAEPLPM